MGPSFVKSTGNFIIRTSRAIFTLLNFSKTQTMISKSDIGGVIVAGGKASRMGFRDKALVPMHGRPLLEYIASNAENQVENLVLNVNHNIECYKTFGLPIVPDRDASYSGPLLGILSAMHWFQSVRADKGISYLACFPGDVPEFPQDVVSQLAKNLSKESTAVAYIRHQDQIQPLFSLWRLGLIQQIEEAVAAGSYGPKLLFGSLKAVAVNCDDNSPGIFCNINSEEDLNAAALLIDRK